MRAGGRRWALGAAMLALFGLAMAVFVLPFAFPTPPPIVTRFQATLLFSPDGDGRRDQATASVRMRVAGEVTLELQRGGKPVRTLRSGPAPAGLVQETWDGRDASGARVPDGTYALKLRARAGARQFNTTRRIVVDTEAPEIASFEVRSAALDGAGAAACRLALTPAGAGRLTIEAFPRGRAGAPVARLGPRPARAGEAVRWRWNGRARNGERMPPGLYVLRARLFDSARNLTEVQATCWVGHLVGVARPVAAAAGTPGARRVGLRLTRLDGTALPAATPVRLRLHRRAGTPGGPPGPVLGPRVARPAAGPLGRVRVTVPPGVPADRLWLIAEAAGGVALVPLTGVEG